MYEHIDENCPNSSIHYLQQLLERCQDLLVAGTMYNGYNIVAWQGFSGGTHNRGKQQCYERQSLHRPLKKESKHRASLQRVFLVHAEKLLTTTRLFVQNSSPWRFSQLMLHYLAYIGREHKIQTLSHHS